MNQTLDAEGQSFVDELLQLGDDSLRNILNLYATIYKCHGGRERKSVSAAECFFGKVAEMGCFYEPALAILITEFNQQFHATMNKTNAELGVPLLALVGSAQHTRAFSVGGVDLVRQLAVAVAVVYGQVYTAAASEMACLEALVCLVIKGGGGHVVKGVSILLVPAPVCSGAVEVACSHESALRSRRRCRLCCCRRRRRRPRRRHRCCVCFSGDFCRVPFPTSFVLAALGARR